ncbi:MAG: nucleotidyltransferase domain-containing protein, partial [Saprospiraceae bacterium]|nr:nucleotidyltransferase domain-containing protein [Saprospiraceae bacterium]
MLEKQELLAFIRQQKPELTDRLHLTKIGIFGSFARGEQTPESDIDLIVEFKP